MLGCFGRMKLGFILFGILAALASLRAAEFQSLESRRYHLRSGTNVEWQEFAASAPRGSRLDVPFTAKSNATEHTLFLWQDDVKQDWRVELNGRRLGSLFLMESPLTLALPIPAGLLRDGSNSLSIVPPRQNDDIRVGELKLAVLLYGPGSAKSTRSLLSGPPNGKPLIS